MKYNGEYLASEIRMCMRCIIILHGHVRVARCPMGIVWVEYVRVYRTSHVGHRHRAVNGVAEELGPGISDLVCSLMVDGCQMLPMRLN
jgi:hypothetical protein